MPARFDSHPQARTGPSREDAHRTQRCELRARMAAERAGLLCSLLGTEDWLLQSEPVVGNSTCTEMLERIANQEEAVISFMDVSTIYSPSENWPVTGTFKRSVARCIDARRRMLDALATVKSEDLFGSPDAANGGPQLLTLVTQCFWNDASLALRIDTWTQRAGRGGQTGPPELLLAATRAARKELLTTIALVPAEARELPIFEGGRTLMEVLGAIVELQQAFLRALTRARLPCIEGTPGDNSDRIDKAVGGDWQRAWTELHATHALLLRTLHGLRDVDFEHPLRDGDAPPESTYVWARGCLLHDRLHAAAIRADLQLDWPERLLR